MTTQYKTTTGLERAIERTIARLAPGHIDDEREYDELNRRVSDLLAQCRCAWANPAQAEHFETLACNLREAWAVVNGDA